MRLKDTWQADVRRGFIHHEGQMEMGQLVMMMTMRMRMMTTGLSCWGCGNAAGGLEEGGMKMGAQEPNLTCLKPGSSSTSIHVLGRHISNCFIFLNSIVFH